MPTRIPLLARRSPLFDNRPPRHADGRSFSAQVDAARRLKNRSRARRCSKPSGEDFEHLRKNDAKRQLAKTRGQHFGNSKPSPNT
jgi:hypothetical protein